MAKLKNKLPPPVQPVNAPKPQHEEKAGDDGDAGPNIRVEQAVAELRRVWNLGHDALNKKPSNPQGHSATKISEAKRLGLSDEWLRQIRRFAERCSREEMESCIDEARQYGYAPHPSTLMTIFEIQSQSARMALWKEAVTQRLSRREILALARVRKLTPAKRQAGSGRRPKVPADPAAALQWVKEQVQFLQSILAAAEGIIELTSAKRQKFQRVQHDMAEFLKSVN